MMTSRTKLSLLAMLATAFVFVACFSAGDTLGNPCTVDRDCDSGQVCSLEVCEIAPATSPDDVGQGGALGQGGEGMVTEPPGEPQAFIRLVHAVVDVEAVDIYEAGNSRPIIEDLSYKDVSPWINVDAGTTGIEIRRAGADPSVSPLVALQDAEIREGERISLIAAGLRRGDEESSLRLLPIREEWGGELAARARIRLVHAGVDLPPVVVEGLEGAAFEIERFEDSGPNGLPIGIEGGEQVELLSGDSLLTSFTLPPLQQGDEVLLIGTGRLDSLAKDLDGFGLLAVGSEGALERILQDPQVYTLHGARDAGRLDNCTNDFELARDITYGQIQSTFVSPGEYSLEVFNYPSGCNGPALNPGGNLSSSLDAGERYLLLITGELTPDDEEPAIQVASFLDRFSRDDESGAQVRFVHGASFTQIFVGSVSDVDTIVEADVYTDPIEWRQESVEQFVRAGEYILGIADANGDPTPEPPLTAIVTFDYQAREGARQWGIVSGDPIVDNENDEPIQLMLVDTSESVWSTELVDP